MSPSTRPRRRSKQRIGALQPVGRLVADRRLALGLTQSELADLSAAGVSSVRRLEAGENTVTLAVLISILDALGLVIAVGPGPPLRAVPEAVVLRPISTDGEPGR